MTDSQARRYRFGPLERRGLIGSLRATQVAVIAASLAISVVLMRILPAGSGLFAAIGLVLAAAAFCFWPLSGRSAEEWLPIAAAHAARRTSGRHRRLSAAPALGVHADGNGRPEPVLDLPDAVQGFEVLETPFRGETVGVVKDSRAKTYTATLAVRVTSFGLLDRSEQETRQAAWGGVLSSLAREGTPVGRIQWVERTVPADGEEIGRYLGEAWDRDASTPDSLPMRSYLALVSAAPAVTARSRAVRQPPARRKEGVAADEARRRQGRPGRRCSRSSVARARGARRTPERS